jgi:hypothetical protein
MAPVWLAAEDGRQRTRTAAERKRAARIFLVKAASLVSISTSLLYFFPLGMSK